MPHAENSDFPHSGGADTSCPRLALNLVAVAAVLDGSLQVNVFLACRIAA
jgi:hypothetical protein